MLKKIMVFLGLINDEQHNNGIVINNAVEENKLNEALSFPVYSPEEYQKEKEERQDKAINGCEFFEPLNIDLFQKNLEFFRDRKCPYCNAELPERKGKTYKCSNCKNKIYRMSAIASKFEGLYTEDDKQKQNEISNEISKRKKFLKVYQDSCSLINFAFDEDKQQNIKRVIIMLHEARPYVKNPKNIDSLRMCRFREAEAQELYGEPSEALNAWLSVAYIDLWGIYNYLYDYRNDYKNTFTEEEENLYNQINEKKKQLGMNYISFEEYKQKEIEKYNKSRQLFDIENSNVAPFVLKKIFNANVTLENLKSLFDFNAKEVSNRVQYEPPVTPQEAWIKIFQLKEESNL